MGKSKVVSNVSATPTNELPHDSTNSSSIHTTAGPNSNDSTSHVLSHFSVLNIQGLKPQTTPSKIPYVEDILKDKNQLFIALTETWLKSHTKAELAIGGYSIFRADRKGRKHIRGRYSGGAAIYLRSDIAATTEKILDFSNGVVEAVAVFSEKENLLICALYRQPDDSIHNHKSGSYELSQALHEISNSIAKLQGTPDILICGDFNLPSANWDAIGEDTGSAHSTLRNSLNQFQNKHFLTQVINLPTNKSGNTLDLVFTNNSQLVNECSSVPTQFSDHYLVDISTHFKSHFARVQCQKKQFSNVLDSLNFFSTDVDWIAINEELSKVPWDTNFAGLDPVGKLNSFLDTCECIMTRFVPKKKTSNVTRRNNIPRDRRILMRRRRKVVKQLSKHPTGNTNLRLNQELIAIELKLQDSYRNASSDQEKKAVDAIKRNPKYFYSYVKKFNKVKPSVGPLINKDGSYETSNIGMSKILSDQYSSVFSTPRDHPIDPNTFFLSENQDDLTDIHFDATDIAAAIDELSSNAAPGPDFFSAYLLKQCKLTLSVPLATIWRDCLDNGVTPDSLKLGMIIPLHKGDSTAIAKNYRPIALTSHLIKIFEKVIRKHIVQHLETTNSFNPSQHGFRAGRSCLSQLLNHYEQILTRLENGFNVDVVYLDFAKAFDKLDFNITLSKLKALGISGKIGRWIHSFLTGRKQSVVVNGTKSPPADVLSGVPQGSVLGPILFLILIGDINQDVAHSFISSFADDTRIGKGINSVEDAEQLQQDLQQVYQWAISNNMDFNTSKFELLRYGNDQDLKNQTCYISNMETEITEKQTVKDLGILMSNSGEFKDHISKVVSTVRDISAWILRSFKSRSPTLMLQLWKSMVIPHLDYCSQLWNPHSVSAIQQLEELQRSYVRRIGGYRHMDYWDALKKLGLYSLQRRRERYQIIYVWTILEGISPNIMADNGLPLITAKSTARRGRTIPLPRVKRTKYSNLRYNSLPYHGARLFNKMPNSLRSLTQISKEKFKTCLDENLKNFHDEPQILQYTSYRRAPSNSLLDMTSASERSRTTMTRGY